jgi:DNA repair protein RadC
MVSPKPFFTMTRQIIFPSEVAEISLSYNCILPRNCATIHCSSDAVEVFRCRWDKSRIGFVEEFKILLMNRANRVLGIVNISQGGISGTVADPKLIFAAALKASVSCIIAAHNHPSGNLTPSQADIQLTHKLKEAGKFLDLPVLDHVILTQESYYSFADEGLL